MIDLSYGFIDDKHNESYGLNENYEQAYSLQPGSQFGSFRAQKSLKVFKPCLSSLFDWHSLHKVTVQDILLSRGCLLEIVSHCTQQDDLNGFKMTEVMQDNDQ